MYTTLRVCLPTLIVHDERLVVVGGDGPGPDGPGLPHPGGPLARHGGQRGRDGRDSGQYQVLLGEKAEKVVRSLKVHNNLNALMGNSQTISMILLIK